MCLFQVVVAIPYLAEGGKEGRKIKVMVLVVLAGNMAVAVAVFTLLALLLQVPQAQQAL
jgi:hypothetical protein